MRFFYVSWTRLAAGLMIVGLAMGLILCETNDWLATTASAERLVPIYFVEVPTKKVALSFDAAWGADHTSHILEVLDENDIQTTFFLVEFWMDKYPEVTRQIAAAGHEIQNHSATHPHFTSLNPEQIRQELEITNERIKALSGQKAVLFRPPFGEYNNLTLQVVKELNMFAIQWDVDSLDWQGLSAGAIADRVLRLVQPGSIVLFHNNADHTAEALPSIIASLKEEGYEILPVSELIYKESYYIEGHNGRQRPLVGSRPASS